MQMAFYGAEEVIDIHHAGTNAISYRLFCSSRNRTVTLTGSSRMQERPKILVEALEQLGAKISYLKGRLSSNPNKGSKITNQKLQWLLM
jgi:5-enolpyruvylshikimate-3-phosphate synthase